MRCGGLPEGVHLGTCSRRPAINCSPDLRHRRATPRRPPANPPRFADLKACRSTCCSARRCSPVADQRGREKLVDPVHLSQGRVLAGLRRTLRGLMYKIHAWLLVANASNGRVSGAGNRNRRDQPERGTAGIGRLERGAKRCSGPVQLLDRPAAHGAHDRKPVLVGQIVADKDREATRKRFLLP